MIETKTEIKEIIIQHIIENNQQIQKLALKRLTKLIKPKLMKKSRKPTNQQQ